MMGTDAVGYGALLLGLILSAIALIKFVWLPVRWFFGSLIETLTTINGKPPKVDKSGRVTEPAQPSLAAHLIDLKQTIADQANQDRRITAVEESIAALQTQHGARLDRLEDKAQLERLAARAESIQAFKTIEAVANTDDPEQQ